MTSYTKKVAVRKPRKCSKCNKTINEGSKAYRFNAPFLEPQYYCLRCGFTEEKAQQLIKDERELYIENVLEPVWEEQI